MRDVDRLAPARREDDVGEVARAIVRTSASASSARATLGKWWLPTSSVSRASRSAAHHLRVPVPEVEDAAVQVQVEELATVEVPEPVALATSDHEVDAERAQRPHPIRADVAPASSSTGASLPRRSSLLPEDLRGLDDGELDHHGREVARHGGLAAGVHPAEAEQQARHDERLDLADVIVRQRATAR